MTYTKNTIPIEVAPDVYLIETFGQYLYALTFSGSFAIAPFGQLIFIQFQPLNQ